MHRFPPLSHHRRHLLERAPCCQLWWHGNCSLKSVMSLRASSQHEREDLCSCPTSRECLDEPITNATRYGMTHRVAPTAWPCGPWDMPIRTWSPWMRTSATPHTPKPFGTMRRCGSAFSSVALLSKICCRAREDSLPVASCRLFRRLANFWCEPTISLRWALLAVST